MAYKICIVLALVVGSIVLTLFLAISRVESHYIDSVDAVSAQIEILEKQLVSSEQVLQMQQMTTLQVKQNATVIRGSRLVLVTAMVSCALAGFLIWLFLRHQLVKPVYQLATAARHLQSDATTVTIPNLQRSDDVGVLSKALESFRLQCIAVSESGHAAEEALQKRESDVREQSRREQDLKNSQARVLELQEALAQAQASVTSDAALQYRIQQLSELVIAAGKGDLKALSKNVDREQSQNDSLGKMAIYLNNLFSQFDDDVVSINNDTCLLTKSACHLQGLGETICADASNNINCAETVLSGAKNVRDVLLQVSSNVGQMESGIQGISGNATQASVVAAKAVELAQNTSGTMRKLADSSVDINKVIKLITSIAEQTNLLALNATIEAARAGDAGKGFAVVANEVKELAKETNKATDEIQRRITTIRTETGHAVEAIGDINEIVSQIDGLQGDISQSVLGQSSAVQSIVALIGSATKDNLRVRTALETMFDLLNKTHSSAEEIQNSSQGLLSGFEGNLKTTRRYTDGLA